MKRTLIFWICAFLSCVGYAQREANIWYFGRFAGIDFNNGPPVSVTGGLNVIEGCSAIADPLTGELLFYTDGVKIRDRNHNYMPACVTASLNGHLSSTQSSVIVPQPGSNTRYYVFTTAANVGIIGPSPSLCCSVVDMALNGGNGDLISMNTILMDSTTEKLAVVGDCTRDVYWIVGHRWNCDSFYAFRLTAAGLSDPVKSSVGVVHTGEGSEATGYMKFSSDGRKLGLVINTEVNTAELFDFDFNTGLISNAVTDVFNAEPFTYRLYGCSFSPDNSKFYVTISGSNDWGRILQYDMNAGDAPSILASRIEIAGSNAQFGALQNGPDGKMYIVRAAEAVLDVIQKPNEPGLASGYTSSALSLGGKINFFGLPGFVESFLSVPDTPRFNIPERLTICRGDTARALQQYRDAFTITPFAGVSYSTDNFTVFFHPEATTTYTAISTNPCFPDTVTFTVHISDGPQAAFLFNPADPAPDDFQLTLDNQSSAAHSYTWYDTKNTFFSDATDPVIDHPGLGTFCYTLIAADTIGCTDTVRQCITIDKYGAVFIPGAFSPNGDGLNDEFRIYGLYLKLERFSVFNRYGERIFHTAEMTKGWDGRYKAQFCDAGTYYYTVQLINGSGQRETRKGNVQLLR